MNSMEEAIINLIEVEENEYINSTDIKTRKNKSQFFTNNNIAEIMTNLLSDFNFNKKRLRILEPSAGFGMLSFNIVRYIINNTNIKDIEIVMYELDKKVVKSLFKVSEYIHTYCEENDVKFEYTINNKDFIKNNTSKFYSEKYDIIITNPPYSKIGKTSTVCKVLKIANVFIEQVNLYQIFMLKCLMLLKENGVCLTLTPRNYLVGKYTQDFRRWIFEKYSLLKIHYFETRAMFKEVNQEVIISMFTNDKSDIISISSNSNIFKTNFKNIVLEKDKLMIGIPNNIDILNKINKLKNEGLKLNDLGITCKVGPVVQFRNLEYLAYEKNKDYSPFLILSDIKDNNILFNDRKTKFKYIANQNPRITKNENMVIIRKVIDKEEKNIIIGAVLEKNFFDSSKIGIDSNLIFFFGSNQELTPLQCLGLYKYLTSETFKNYYLTINGTHTINMFELESMYFPDINTLEEIAKNNLII